MEIQKVLKALGDPTRYEIFLCLLERKHCVRSLSKKLGISESAVSQHMKVMKEAGLVSGEKYGHHVHYLPEQEAIDCLAETFIRFQDLSRGLDRDMTRCQCEYREGGK